MTFRKIVSYGLIAGLTYTEMTDLSPGFVMDCFIRRRDYDDEMHGIRRGDNSWEATLA